MGYLWDALTVFIGSVVYYFLNDIQEARLVAGAAIILAGLCWAGCSFYTQLWNTRFRLSWSHHMFCGMASLLTLFFVPFYASLKHAKDIAEMSVTVWDQQIHSDQMWSKSTFVKAYEAVKKTGSEDFSNYTHPDRGGTLIPMSNQVSRRKSAEVYVNESVSHFEKNRPFLSLMLYASKKIPTVKIDESINDYFSANPGSTYPLANAIKLAASEIKKDLLSQVHRVVPIARIVCVIVFLLVQLIPFGLVGWAAYKDIKIHTF